MLTFLVVLFVLLLVCMCVSILGAVGSFLILALSREPERSPKDELLVPIIEDGARSDRETYERLAREMLQYASRPGVVYHQEIEAFGAGYAFRRTTTDQFGRKRYVELQQRYADRLRCRLFLYEDGSWLPSERAVLDVPTDEIEWNVYQANISDLRERGSKLTYWDARGRRQQVRLPVTCVEVRV